jgi:hypothetical protein
MSNQIYDRESTRNENKLDNRVVKPLPSCGNAIEMVEEENSWDTTIIVLEIRGME